MCRSIRFTIKPLFAVLLLVSLWGCASLPLKKPAARNADADLTALRRQIEDIHGNRDVAAFGALHTDGVVYEWRGRRPVELTGRAALESSQRDLWANRRELRLNLQVSELQIHTDHAYEFGSYEETWIDPQGSRVTEFGRYVTTYAREVDGQWRIARTLGFTDLTATSKASE